MKEQCKYGNCRMEAERDSIYCNYHVRMAESYEKMWDDLKKLYDRIRKDRISLIVNSILSA